MQTLTLMDKLASYHATAEQIESEEKLIKAAQANPRDFEPLYKKYYERIANFVYRRVDNKNLAFEITSNVFYNALNNLPKYKPQGVPFSSWLFRIASNEISLWFRRNKTQRTLSIDNNGLSELKENIEEKSAEIDAQLFEALQNLEPHEVELITMRYFEKISFREICEINGTSESATKMKLYRILEKLKLKLTATLK